VTGVSYLVSLYTLCVHVTHTGSPTQDFSQHREPDIIRIILRARSTTGIPFIIIELFSSLKRNGWAACALVGNSKTPRKRKCEVNLGGEEIEVTFSWSGPRVNSFDSLFIKGKLGFSLRCGTCCLTKCSCAWHYYITRHNQLSSQSETMFSSVEGILPIIVTLMNIQHESETEWKWS